MRKTRVLQVIYSAGCGGIETWLIHVLKNINKNQFEIDFLIFSSKDNFYRNEIYAEGSKIFYCTPPPKVKHFLEFNLILKNNKPYDVIHSHDPLWNGTSSFIAWLHNVPIRIAHVHNNFLAYDGVNLFKKIYLYINIFLAKYFATRLLVCSKSSANSYYGNNWRLFSSLSIFYCSEDFSVFKRKVNALKIRNSLKIPKKTVVIGHVGSFRPIKNHNFIIEIAKEILKKNHSIYWLLIGDGYLLDRLRSEIKSHPVNSKIIFLGARKDVPFLMKGAMDFFIFPSLQEGLGLSMIEAQASGLSIFCSNTIPKEADLIPDLINRISLKKNASFWADKILKEIYLTKKKPQEKYLSIVEKSMYSIGNSINSLESMYKDNP